MEINKKRIKILEKRINQLNNWAILQTLAPNENITFAKFLEKQGISRERFIKDLPPEYQNPPSHGLQDIMAYADLLNNHMLYLMNEEGMFSAAGSADEPWMSCDGCADCPCNKGEMFSASGCGLPPVCIKTKVVPGFERKCTKILGKEVCAQVPTMKVIPNDECLDKWKKYDECRSGKQETGEKCGIMPLPPPVPKIKATQHLWDEYNKKKDAWNECRKIKKDMGQNMGLHLFNKTNIGLATSRAAFLRLVEFNIFGLASTFNKMRQDPDQGSWNNIKTKWYNIGGEISRLDSNTSIGQNKKPIFKPKGWKPKGGTVGADGMYYNAEPYTTASVAALIASALGILGSLAKTINEFKKQKGEPPLNYEGADDPNYAGEPGQPDVPVTTGDGLGGELSSQTKTIMYLAIGIPLAGLLGWGIYKLATNK